MSKIIFSNKPKIILAVASATCAIGGFLPWLAARVGDSAYHEDGGPLTDVFLICGLIPLLLDIATIITKEKTLNILTTVFGIICSVAALIYIGITAFGISYLHLNSYLGIGFWITLISAIAMFVFSIVSAKNKEKSEKPEKE